MSKVYSERLQYKTDDFGNPLWAKVCWEDGKAETKPIVIILHGGGLVLASSEVIPQPQISYLTAHNFLVVIPNYRLAPQVDAVKGAIADTHSAFEWSQKDLVKTMREKYDQEVDGSRVSVMGMSSGGQLALHLGARGQVDIRAVNSSYPSLYHTDPDSTVYEPYGKPPFGTAPDFHPTKEDWESICPEGLQISESELPVSGTFPAPRFRYMADLIKHGKWMEAIAPNGNIADVDPCTRFASVGASWPPTIFVQGDQDDLPGSGLDLAERAVNDLKVAGAKTVELEVVVGEGHMFDSPPEVGTTDLGPRWQSVKKGLDFLIAHT